MNLIKTFFDEIDEIENQISKDDDFKSIANILKFLRQLKKLHQFI